MFYHTQIRFICHDGNYIRPVSLVMFQALPDDLKTKLSLDDDTVSSPKEALSRASVDSRMKYLHGYLLIPSP